MGGRCAANDVVDPARTDKLELAKDDMAAERHGKARERLLRVVAGGGGERGCADDVDVVGQALLDVIGRRGGKDKGNKDFRASDGYRRREGREMGALYIGAIGFGLLTDAFLHMTLDIDTTAQTAGGVGLLSVGAAVTGVYLLDRGEGARWGVPSGIVAGGVAGLVAGGYSIGTWNAIATQEQELDEEQSFQLMWGLGAAGALGGLLGATALELTPGQTTLFPVLQTWTSLVALGVMGAMTAPGDRADDKFSTAGLIGSFAGLGGAAYMIAQGVEPDDGRLAYINLGGVGGMVSGLLLGLTFEIDGQQSGFALVTATGAAGLGLATYLTRNMHETKERWAPWVSPNPAGAGGGVAGIGGRW